MNRRFIKILLTAVLVALFYYNVAWAVLRCAHQENHAAQAIAAHEPSSLHPEVNIDCSGPKYHTEFLAGPSKTTSVSQLAGDAGFNGLLIVPDHSETVIYSSTQPVLHGRLSAAYLPIGPPRYLSLAVFRL